MQEAFQHCSAVCRPPLMSLILPVKEQRGKLRQLENFLEEIQ